MKILEAAKSRATGYVDDIKDKLGFGKKGQAVLGGHQKFIAAIKEHGLAQSHVYKLHINRGSEFEEFMSMYAKSIELPTMSVLTKEYRIGNLRTEMPYDFSFSPEITIVFHGDRNFKIYNMLYEWMNQVSNMKPSFNAKVANDDQGFQLGYRDASNGQSGYGADITVQLMFDTIENIDSFRNKATRGLFSEYADKFLGKKDPDLKYSPEQTPSVEFVLNRAYPKTLTPPNLNSDQYGFCSFQATFAFETATFVHMNNDQDYSGLKPREKNALERFIEGTVGTLAGQLKTKVISNVIGKTKTKWL